MRTEARHTFVLQFNELIDRCAMSAGALRKIAKSHGIAYSTLQSWRTGEHLPRVPEDNPGFRGFIEAIATSQDAAKAIMATAITAWRHYIAGKRAKDRRLDVLAAHLLHSRTKLVVIWGPAGTSALANRLASEVSRLAAWEPVSVELDASTSPDEAMARVLGAVLPGISGSVEVTRHTYQHLLASRPMLLLLNDATNAEQVLPLADGAAAIVTSRHPLPELERRGALCVGLGPVRTEQRPPDPTPAHRDLTGIDRIVFRRIAESPCRDLTAPAIAVLAAVPNVDRELRRLTEANLLRRDHAGRYSVPETVREFGSQADEGRRAAVCRLAAYYARRTTVAAATVYADMPRLVDAPAGRFESDSYAASWLITERANILATASAAFGEHTDLACSLADALRAFHQVLPQGMDWTSIAEAGLHAAREAGCPLRMAAMHLAAGVASFGAGQYELAIGYLRQAYERYRVLRRPHERAHTCLVLSAVEHATGNLTAARAHCVESLRLRRRKGQDHGQASSLVFLADIGADFRPDAEREAVAALTLSRRVGYTAGVAGALGVLGRLAVGDGRLDEAAGHFGTQLAMSEEHGFGSRQAIALVGLAKVRLLTGHHEEANQLADKAAVTAREWANATAYVDALNVAGSAHLSRGRYAEAFTCHRGAVVEARRTGYQRGHAESLTGLEHARRITLTRSS